VVRKRTPTKFSNNFNDYKESPMFTYVACEFWLNRVLAQVNSIAAKRSRQRWSQKRVYSRMVVFSTNISMSLRATAPRNRRKNFQQVVLSMGWVDPWVGLGHTKWTHGQLWYNYSMYQLPVPIWACSDIQLVWQQKHCYDQLSMDLHRCEGNRDRTFAPDTCPKNYHRGHLLSG